jgi:phage tail sheath protein FI
MSYGTPGIYVEESTPRLNPIIEAGTGVTAFLGFTQKGPANKAVALGSFDDFQRVFGDSQNKESASYAVKGFFDNGGNKAYFVRLSAYNTTTGVEQGGTASHLLNLDGTNATFTIKAGYRGVEAPGASGNDLFFTIKEDSLHPSQAAGSDISADIASASTEFKVPGIVGIKAGSIIKLFDSNTNNTETAVVRRVASALNSGVVEHTVYLESALANAYVVGTTTLKTLEYTINVIDQTGIVLETWSKLSFSELSSTNVDLVINDPQLGSRYIITETVLASDSFGDLSAALAGDATLGTGKALSGGSAEYTGYTTAMFAGTELVGKGIHALDPITEISLVVAPPTLDDVTNTWGVQANATFHSILLDYAKNRMDLFAILDAPAGKSASEVQVYRENTLGSDSYWGAMYYPHLKIQDPKRPQTSATIVVPPSGHIAGIYSRVDGIPAPQGGVSAAPAGISNFGRVEGVLGVEKLVSDNEQSSLNPIGINCIRLLDRATGGKGVFVFGARTLSTDLNFKYVPMRRTLTFVEESVRLSTQFAIFKKNGPELWSELRTVINSFLRTFWANGNLAGQSEREAFFVEIDGNTTSSDDINNGIIRGRIGVSLFRPAEFIVFTFTQTQAGSSVEEG